MLHFTYKPVIWFAVQIKWLVSIWNATLGLTLFLPMFPSDPPETIRKPKVFWCFQGDQKGTLGRKVLNGIILDSYRFRLALLLMFRVFSIFLLRQRFTGKSVILGRWKNVYNVNLLRKIFLDKICVILIAFQQLIEHTVLPLPFKDQTSHGSRKYIIENFQSLFTILQA